MKLAAFWISSMKRWVAIFQIYLQTVLVITRLMYPQAVTVCQRKPNGKSPAGQEVLRCLAMSINSRQNRLITTDNSRVGYTARQPHQLARLSQMHGESTICTVTFMSGVGIGRLLHRSKMPWTRLAPHQVRTELYEAAHGRCGVLNTVHRPQGWPSDRICPGSIADFEWFEPRPTRAFLRRVLLRPRMLSDQGTQCRKGSLNPARRVQQHLG